MKPTTEVLRRLRRAGWDVKRGRKHWIARPPAGGGQIVVSATPSDERSMKNLRAALRRAGMDL